MVNWKCLLLGHVREELCWFPDNPHWVNEWLTHKDQHVVLNALNQWVTPCGPARCGRCGKKLRSVL